MRGSASKRLEVLLYRSGGTIKKRRVWLEKLIGECEEEIEKLKGLGYIIKLETRYKYFDLKVLYKIDGTGGGRIRIKNKSREGGDTILLIRPINIKALLNCIIEDGEEERNAEVGV